MSAIVSVNFGKPENMTQQVMEAFLWLDEVNDAAIGFTVGVHEEEGGHVYDDGEMTVAGVAHQNEFGIGVPQRAFMSEPFDRNIAKYSKMIEDFEKVRSKDDLNRAMVATAEIYRGDVQSAISNREYADNATATILLKGSDTPLVDTGRMRQSILTKPVS